MLTIPVDDALIREIVERIVRIARPYSVIAFGSRARGDARPDSDIDLLIIAPSTEPRYRRSVPIYGVLSDIFVPMDIMVYTPEEVEEWSQVPQAFVTTAIRDGKVLYEKPGRPGKGLATQGAERSDGIEPMPQPRPGT